MLEEISGMYSSVFGTKAGPDREKHPVVFLPDGSKKVDLNFKKIIQMDKKGDLKL